MGEKDRLQKGERVKGGVVREGRYMGERVMELGRKIGNGREG